MFGTDGAAKIGDNVVDQTVKRFPAIEKCLFFHLDRLGEVEMDIAIADMAKRAGANARNQIPGGCHATYKQFRHLGNRDRHIMLDTAAYKTLRLGDAFADRPKIGALGLGLCQCCVAGKASLKGGFQKVA